MHTPDNWVVIFLNGDDPHYRVLAGWSGGYTTGDSWRLNSGIVRVEEDKLFYYFYGSSGSCYKCHKKAYCLRMNTAGIWNQLQEKFSDKVEMMPEDTDWLNHDWIIK
jgi:V8-like Glu-specific endopeptidase